MFSYISVHSPRKIILLRNLSQTLHHSGRITSHNLRKTIWSLSLFKEQSWLAKSQCNSPQLKTPHFELQHGKTLQEIIKPFYICNKEFYVSTEQAAFWLQVEVVCCQPTPFFTKHDGLKSQGRRSIGRHLPLPQRVLLSRPTITDEATKNELKIYDVKLKMYDVKFEI